MDKSISKRLNLIMDEYGLNPHSLSIRVGTSDTVIRNILHERNEPGFKLINNIIQSFVEVSPEWLLTGIGEMKREKYQKRFIEQRIDEIENQLKMVLSKINIETGWKGMNIKENVPLQKTKKEKK